MRVFQKKQVGKRQALKRQILLIAVITLVICCLFTGCRSSGDKEDAGATKATEQTQARQESTTQVDNDQLLATLFFASDYQKVEGLPTPAENLAAIMASAGADGIDPDRVVLCGDYTNDRNLHDYQISPEDSIAEIRSLTREAFPDVEDEDMTFIQGNHDKMTDSITETGLHEYDDYLIYVLNTQEDFPWKQGKVSGCLDKVKKSSSDMKKCFDELIADKEKRPVFIAGHVPLHFTARTSSRHTTGDNLYSSLIFDVVNEAGKNLDIIYLYGHDHSKGWDCYMGGGCVYKGKGETLLIPRFKESDVNTDEFTEETLSFTYLNAGYVGYYMNCGPEEYDAGRAGEYEAADGTMTGTTFRIYPNRVEIGRYDKDGAHVLGAAGEADPYKGGIDKGLIGEEYYSVETGTGETVQRR